MTKEELKAWRESQGLTQKELAEALGVRKLAVSRWERGERGIPAPLRLALRSLEAPKPKGKAAAKHIKLEGASGPRKPSKYPGPYVEATLCAAIAINELSRIISNDPKRQVAFEKVITWITKNR